MDCLGKELLMEFEPRLVTDRPFIHSHDDALVLRSSAIDAKNLDNA